MIDRLSSLLNGLLMAMTADAWLGGRVPTKKTVIQTTASYLQLTPNL